MQKPTYTTRRTIHPKLTNKARSPLIKPESPSLRHQGGPQRWKKVAHIKGALQTNKINCLPSPLQLNKLSELTSNMSVLDPPWRSKAGRPFALPPREICSGAHSSDPMAATLLLAVLAACICGYIYWRGRGLRGVVVLRSNWACDVSELFDDVWSSSSVSLGLAMNSLRL